MTNNTQIANLLNTLDSVMDVEDQQATLDTLQSIYKEAPVGTAQLMQAFIKLVTNNNRIIEDQQFSEDQVSLLERMSYELFEMNDEDNYDNTYDRPGAYEEDA